MTFTTAVSLVHLPRWFGILFIGAVGVGLLLLILPGREKTKS
jgi:hypothetical protein